MCRFSDAGDDEARHRLVGRRRKSAKARNRGGVRLHRRRGLYGDLTAASCWARLDRSVRLGGCGSKDGCVASGGHRRAGLATRSRRSGGRDAAARGVPKQPRGHALTQETAGVRPLRVPSRAEPEPSSARRRMPRGRFASAAAWRRISLPRCAGSGAAIPAARSHQPHESERHVWTALIAVIGSREITAGIEPARRNGKVARLTGGPKS